MNILDEANKIVNERSEEKERSYGSFSEGMKRAASIASGMTGKHITADDMFACMIALKFSRQSFNHKTDNLLDAVAYIGALNNYLEEEQASSYPKTPKKSSSDEKYEKLSKKLDSILSDENIMNEYLEDSKHFSPLKEQDLGQNEFKKKFEEEVFGEEKLQSWSSMSPAQAFKEFDEKLKIITDSIIEMMNKVNMNTEYAKYLAENIDKNINYSEYLGENLNKTMEDLEILRKSYDAGPSYDKK